MIAILDYGAGNLRSVEKALRHIGCDAAVTGDPEVLRRADGAVLPGVGAFGDAMDKLCQYGLVPVIHEAVDSGIPFLGICLGLQLLFESSEESPGVEGLGICKGRIVRIPKTQGLKIPHMGWNSLQYDHPGRLFAGIPEGSYVYFVHSYYLQAQDDEIVKASAQYAAHIHASIEQGNVFACQLHPEKSGEVGLAILRNFIGISGKCM